MKKVSWSSDLKTQSDNLHPNIAEASSPASRKVGSDICDNSPKVKELPVEDALLLTEKARQRRCQHLARQFAKALDQVDGLCYQADLEFRKRQVAKPPPQQASESSSQPSINKWVRVKRTRSTLKERIQKHHVLLAHVWILMLKEQEL